MDDCCAPKGGQYDLAVVGAGSAGFSAAITAADAGATVALIGHGTIGGTCVNVGCVPSKAMIRGVEIMHQTRAAQRFDGVRATAEITDWAALVRQKQQLVDDLRAAKYIDVLPSYPNVTYIEGKARLMPDGTLTVGGEPIAAAKIIIATGSRPHVPAIAGLDAVDWLDSTRALELEELPESLVVMGGGFIGVELAQMFARAGSRVTLVTRRGLLPGAEPEISAALTSSFTEEGIRVFDGLRYNAVAANDRGMTLQATTRDGEDIAFSARRLLLATGRVANTDGLGLDDAGVMTDARAAIVTDPMMRTTRDGIYAAGDVTGRDQFVYMAAYGARLAATNAIGAGDALTYDNDGMPSVVFSDPQLASVGLTEAQARKAGHDVVTSVLPLEHVPRALAARDVRGLIKLVAERGSKRLLGAHVLAPEGADTIQTAALAVRAGMTYEDLGATIFPYLTTVEGLKLAAQTFEKDVAKLSCCAG